MPPSLCLGASKEALTLGDLTHLLSVSTVYFHLSLSAMFCLPMPCYNTLSHSKLVLIKVSEHTRDHRLFEQANKSQSSEL